MSFLMKWENNPPGLRPVGGEAGQIGWEMETEGTYWGDHNHKDRLIDEEHIIRMLLGDDEAVSISWHEDEPKSRISFNILINDGSYLLEGLDIDDLKNIRDTANAVITMIEKEE